LVNLFDYDDPNAMQSPAGEMILGDLSEAEWEALLNFVERKHYAVGARVLRQGEADRTLYILLSGQVEVIDESSRNRKLIATIYAGSVLGELAFFDGAPRSATVFATQASELLALPYSSFDKLATWHPRIARALLFDLGRVLSGRLRRAEKAQ
jgi:CRP-like cAMP-binding protein